MLGAPTNDPEVSVTRRVPLVGVLVLLLAQVLSGCSSVDQPAGSPTGQVEVTGAYGQSPLVTIPSGPAPTVLTERVLKAGTGPVVRRAATLVANYVARTWEDPSFGYPREFVNTFTSTGPLSYPIGSGDVIRGWDKALVGERVGSRVLLVVPPELALGGDLGDPNVLAGRTLVFVVDILGVHSRTAHAEGTVLRPDLDGLPSVTARRNRPPVISSVAGVTHPDTPGSALLVEGRGAPIDPARRLALQMVEADVRTGSPLNTTWGVGVQMADADDVLLVMPALRGQRVGSRVVAIVPGAENQNGTPQGTAAVVADVVGQY